MALRTHGGFCLGTNFFFCWVFPPFSLTQQQIHLLLEEHTRESYTAALLT